MAHRWLERKYGLMIWIGLNEKDGSKLYDLAILTAHGHSPLTAISHDQ